MRAGDRVRGLTGWRRLLLRVDGGCGGEPSSTADHASGGKPAEMQYWKGVNEAGDCLISSYQRTEQDDQNDSDASKSSTLP